MGIFIFWTIASIGWFAAGITTLGLVCGGMAVACLASIGSKD